MNYQLMASVTGAILAPLGFLFILYWAKRRAEAGKASKIPDDSDEDESPTEKRVYHLHVPESAPAPVVVTRSYVGVDRVVECEGSPPEKKS